MTGTRRQISAMGLCAAAAIMAVAAGAKADMPAQNPANGEAQGRAICAAALTNTSLSPPRQYARPPIGTWSTSPADKTALVASLQKAAPDPSTSVPFACGVVKYDVTPEGKVENPVALSEFPQGIGLGDALVRYLASKVYPAKAAGGPYAMGITIRVHGHGPNFRLGIAEYGFNKCVVASVGRAPPRQRNLAAGLHCCVPSRL